MKNWLLAVVLISSLVYTFLDVLHTLTILKVQFNHKKLFYWYLKYLAQITFLHFLLHFYIFFFLTFHIWQFFYSCGLMGVFTGCSLQNLSRCSVSSGFSLPTVPRIPYIQTSYSLFNKKKYAYSNTRDIIALVTCCFRIQHALMHTEMLPNMQGREHLGAYVPIRAVYIDFTFLAVDVD